MKIVIALLIVSISINAFAAHHSKRQHIPRQVGIFTPNDLSLIMQNQEIDRLGLQRMQDDTDLRTAIDNGDLVPLPETDGIIIAKSLPADRRYCQPWTAQFLQDLGAVYFANFRQYLYVDSAVRTVKVQSWLRRIMGSRAAPIKGDLASSHLAGLTVDISLNHLTNNQKQFVEYILSYLYANNLVLVEEERRNRCLHIMVMGAYKEGNI